jgi:hypothetical protein
VVGLVAGELAVGEYPLGQWPPHHGQRGCDLGPIVRERG